MTDEQAEFEARARADANYLKALFECLVLAPVRAAEADKGIHMTPKEQIQAEAAKASTKIREAMNEFAEVTGMTAQVDIYWHEGNVRRIVESVHIKTEEGFVS